MSDESTADQNYVKQKIYDKRSTLKGGDREQSMVCQTAPHFHPPGAARRRLAEIFNWLSADFAWRHENVCSPPIVRPRDCSQGFGLKAQRKSTAAGQATSVWCTRESPTITFTEG